MKGRVQRNPIHDAIIIIIASVRGCACVRENCMYILVCNGLLQLLYVLYRCVDVLTVILYMK